jgi:hypothetical protein
VDQEVDVVAFAFAFALGEYRVVEHAAPGT